MRTGSSIVVIVCAIAMVSGCSSTKPVHPVTITEGNIGVSSQFQGKNVISIEILTKDETAHPKRVPMISPKSGLIADMDSPGPFTSVWAVKAKSPVSAKDLQVIPGTVPQGFHQVVPSPSGKFIPVKGQEYYVVMMVEPADDSFYSMGSKWIP